MLIKTLQQLQQALAKNPKIEVKKWEIGPPATDLQVKDFEERISKHWKQVPKTFLDVYRQVNGIHFEWKHEANVYGGMHLMPLDQVFTYDHWFEWPQPMGDRVYFYLLDFYMPEWQFGLYVAPDGPGVEDCIVSKSKDDEHGEDMGLTLAQYLDRVLKAWGTHDIRLFILDPDHLENEYDIETNKWPFKDIEKYVQAIDPEYRMMTMLTESPTDWIIELKDLGYEISSANSRYDFREWKELKRGEITFLQLRCSASTAENTDVFATFPKLERLSLDNLNPNTNLKGLSNCASLHELWLVYQDLGPAIPQLDAYMYPSVKQLHLGGEGKNWNWRFLAKFPALKELKLLNRLLSMGDAIKGMTGKHQTFFR
jgi:hypothetical protein